MSVSNPQLQERTDEFRRLLCDVSQNLVETEVTQIEYLTYMHTGTKRTGIELLIELEKRGVFSPTDTEPLVKLLEDVKRHDIAKYIRDEYQTKYPDQNDDRPVSRTVTRTTSLPTPPELSPYLVEHAVTLNDVPVIYVSADDSQPQLQESSINDHHPPLPSGDIYCDGYTKTKPPQSPPSVTSFSTNEDNLPSRIRSLPSITENLHSNVILRSKPPEVDKRSSSWSEGDITVNVSPSKSSETLPEDIEQRHHKPSYIPKKDSYTTSASKLSDVSLSPLPSENSVYVEALKHGKEPISYVRVMFLGEGESGKSSMLDGLMKKKFTEKKDSTMLAETRDISYQFIEAEKGQWTEMDEKATVTELAKKVMRGSEASIYDDKEWPQAEEEFGKETDTLSQGETELVSDLAEKASDTHKQCCEVVSSKAQKLEEHISLSSSDVLHVWDCGGQPVFLDILSAFITARTIFLLLFDASKNLFCNKVRETGVRVGDSLIPGRKLIISRIQLMIQWMQLIYASLVCKSQDQQHYPFPRIIMIGSRGDKIDASKQKELQASLEAKCAKEAFSNIILCEPLIIDNTTAGKEEEDPGYGKIRDKIHHFAVDLTVETPHAWIVFRTVLKDTVAERKQNAKYMLSFNEVVTIANSCNIPSESVGGMLEFYHELGVFLHYAKIDLLKDRVFIDPQWLFQQLCKLLMPHCYGSNLLIPISHTNNLRQYGILQLTPNLERAISKECGLSSRELVTLLEYFDLAQKVEECPQVFKHITGDRYFIPCMLEMRPYSATELTIQNTTTQQVASRLHIVFEMGYVPPGFFVRLIAQMTTQLKPMFDSGVYRDRIMFRLSPNNTVTLSEPSSLRSIQVDFVKFTQHKLSKHVLTEECLTFRNMLYDMSVKVLCWLPQIKPFFAFSCMKDKHFIDLEMKMVDGCVSSEKHQGSLMFCDKCPEVLQIKQEHKYWLPLQKSEQQQHKESSATGVPPTSEALLAQPPQHVQTCTSGYDRVRCNMNGIITALKSTPGATDMLTGMYKQKGWMNFTEHPTEDQLITLALQRIKQDHKQYDMFIDMLRGIPGMDLTVDRITSS